MMMEMITPIAIDEEIFGPKMTMIIGPSATLAWRLGRRDMDQVRGREGYPPKESSNNGPEHCSKNEAYSRFK